MRSLYWGLVVALQCFGVVVAAATYTVSDSTTALSKSVGGKVKVSVLLVPAPQLVAEDEYWGAGAGKTLVVSQVALTIDGVGVWVPRSAYADLAAVSNVRVKWSGRRLSVMLTGGETATFYSARFDVVHRTVVSRRVWLNALPNVYEKTTYHMARE